ncbi:MAG: hypothetical protein ABUK01_15745 [Leptospirales bacterium]
MWNFIYRTLLSTCLLFVFLNSGLFAQAPPGIKWYKINTGKYEIVFPAELEYEARKLANIVNELDTRVGASIDSETKKVTIILDNVNSYSNAYAALMPRYSQFYHTPPVNSLYYEDWTLLLAIHEIRHIAQYDKLNTDFSKVYYVFFGQSGTAFLSSFLLPRWFSEGDSVYLETQLSKTGRGRLPEFTMLSRTLLQSGNPLSYSTAFYGSYIKPGLGPYELGYLLVAHVRRKYGEEVWGEIMTHIASSSYFPPWLFSRALKKYTGKTKSALYAEAMEELRVYWDLRSPKSPEVLEPINPDKRVFTEYRFPAPGATGEVYGLKYGKFDHHAIVKIDKTGEEKTLRLVPLNVQTLSSRSGKFAWEETIYGVRYSTTRSVIKVYNLNTRKTKKITSKLNLKSPTISPKGEKLAAIGFDKSGSGFITFWNIQTSAFIRMVDFPKGETPVAIGWGNSNDSLSVVTQTWKGRQIYSYDYNKGRLKIIAKDIPTYLDSPFAHKQWVFFHGTFNGMDNIFAFNIKNKKYYRVTNVRYGAFDPFISADGKTLYYTDFTSKGRSIVKKTIKPSQWVAVKPERVEPVLMKEESQKSIDWEKTAMAEVDLPVKRYSKFFNALNLHSWSIVPTLNLTGVVLSLTSTDKMNTMDVVLSSYYGNRSNYEIAGAVNFRAWYPIITVLGGTGEFFGYNTEGALISGKYKRANARITLPLILSRGLWDHGIYLGPTAGVIDPENFKSDGVSLQEDNRTNYFYGVFFEHYLHKSGNKNLFRFSPSFTERIYAEYTRNAVLTTSGFGENFLINGLLSFPGFFQNHAFTFFAEYQLSDFRTRVSPFNQMGQYPRGYETTTADNIIMHSANYSFPLIYADVNLIPWTLFVYCKLIKANLFYDYAILGNYLSTAGTVSSTGVDILFEIIPFDLGFSFDTGVRFVYLFNEDKTVVQSIFNLSFQLAF